ncbi:hypothetical protein OAF59_00995 [bacterium]|nr:hypothetical protein [bacterium]
MGNSSIIWSPIFSNLSRNLENGEGLTAIIAPFMKVDALSKLLELPGAREVAVITRWHPEEILSGVSDLAIYPLLKARGIPLYIHDSIHLKLLIFDSDRAFCSSANATSMGLGLRNHGNLEAGALVQLQLEDFLALQWLRNASRLVTDEVYDAYKACIAKAEQTEVTLPDLALPEETEQMFLLSMLPATESPERLWELYSAPESVMPSKEDQHRLVHDLCAYGLPMGLSRDDLDRRLGAGFRTNPFIKEIVALIKQEGSIRFGGVNDFIHRTCRDVPLPYRWEIKSTTSHLYNWLAHYYTEITWDRPNYSQVAYWRPNSQGSK